VARVWPKALDHVALWVTDRDSVVSFATAHLGMHVIDRTDAFTLLGADARRGKLTLFPADGPRDRGALEHVALRVSSLEAALSALPGGLAVEFPRNGEAYFDVGPDGLRLGLVETGTDAEYDVDHVALRSADPEEAAGEYGPLGFRPAAPGPSRAPRVEVGGTWIELRPGAPGRPERPLLNHLGVLVDSADEHLAAARDLGVEVDDVVDAPNTYAVFLRGPEGVRIEYVEHKPTFSLT
jgi:catechol 2,3-dioxygenase-like lactoylglutathione lyase family enzyme